MYHETRSVYSDIHLPEVNNNLVSPRPITDLGVRKALNNDITLVNKMVKPEDEKILSLITKRGEVEHSLKSKRLKSRMAWDNEKLASDKIKREKDMNHRAKIELLREEDRQMVQMKKLERQKRRLKRKVDMLTELERSSKQSERRIRKQRKLRDKKIKELADWETDNKTRQENKWWEHNSGQYKRKMTEKQEHDKKRNQATEKRLERLNEEHQKIMKENEKERMMYTKRYVVYEKKMKAKEKALMSRIEHRMNDAQENHDKQFRERLKEIQADAEKEESRLKQALKTQETLERDHHKRMITMLHKTQQGIEQANANIEQAFDRLKEHIRKEREGKEQIQKKQLNKLNKDNQQKRRQMKKEITNREEKMRDKQEERQQIMERTRSVANDSRVLRSRLLDRFGNEDFDRKVFRVERFRSLGSRPSTHDWNTSSISLL